MKKYIANIWTKSNMFEISNGSKLEDKIFNSFLFSAKDENSAKVKASKLHFDKTKKGIWNLELKEIK